MTNSETYRRWAVTLMVASSLAFFQDVVGLGQRNFRSTETVEYCKLLSSTQYDGRVVRTRAILNVVPIGPPRVDGGSDDYFFSPHCNNGDNFTVAEFDRKSFSQLRRKVPINIRHTRKPRRFSVDFIGRISVADVPSVGELGWSRARFDVRHVFTAQMIDDETTAPDHAAATPTKDRGKEVRDLNIDTLISLFLPKTVGKFQRGIETRSVSVNGKLSTANALTELVRATKSDSVAVTTSSLRFAADNEICRVHGIVRLAASDRSKAEYMYESVYKIVQGNWELLSVTLNETGR